MLPIEAPDKGFGAGGTYNSIITNSIHHTGAPIGNSTTRVGKEGGHSGVDMISTTALSLPDVPRKQSKQP